jgi:hypothetical protein
VIDDYFETVRELIAVSPVIRSSNVAYDRRSDEFGFMRGDLYFIDDSHLHFREFVRQIGNAPAERYTYAFHYKKADGVFVFRYDDTRHYPHLPNFPHHKHVGDESNVTSVSPPDLASVLKEIESLIAVD